MNTYLLDMIKEQRKTEGQILWGLLFSVLPRIYSIIYISSELWFIFSERQGIPVSLKAPYKN